MYPLPEDDFQLSIWIYLDTFDHLADDRVIVLKAVLLTL